MKIAEKHDHDDTDGMSSLLVGRKIVKAEFLEDKDVPREVWRRLYPSSPVGLWTLDSGKRVYVAGNGGCGGCTSGWYELVHLAAVDNIITAVNVIDKRDESKGWSVFVIAANEKLRVAKFSGDDGSGWYGTGFLFVVMGEGEDEDEEN